MQTLIQTTLPSAAQWAGLAGCILAALAFLGLGRLVGRGSGLPGSQFFIGWGLYAAFLTVVGGLTDWPYLPVFWAATAIGLVGAAWLLLRDRAAFDGDLARVFLLGLPLVVLAAAKAPSEVDTFTHWLFNGLYLVEQDGLPKPDRAATQSAYGGFPHNVTFLFYVASRLAGHFVENTVIVFNVLTLLCFAGLLVWLIRRGAGVERGHGWALAAFGLLAATLLNPVFVRKLWLTSYPDPSTAVITAFAGIAGWLWIETLARRDGRDLSQAVAFGLILTLLVNIKQSNLVIVVAMTISLGLVALRDPEIRPGDFFRRLPVVLGPPLLLFGCWRLYINEVMPLNENELKPFSKWNLSLFGDVLWRMGVVILKKSPFFALAFAIAGWGIWAWLRRPRTAFERLAIIVGGTYLAFNLFLLLIFFAHFGGYPQSYWRFNTHVGYLVVATAAYGLALAYARWARGRLAISPLSWQRFAVCLVVAVPLTQIALVSYWRFDLEVPKIDLRRAGLDLGRMLPDDAVVFATVPGDGGNFTTILQYYAIKGRPGIRVAPVAQPERLPDLVAETTGQPTFVWTYCRQDWLERDFGVSASPGQAVMIRAENGAWQVARTWPHTPSGGIVGVYKDFDPGKCRGG